MNDNDWQLFSAALGSAISHLRREQGYTQEKLSEKADIHATYLSEIERGKRNISIQILLKLANALKVTPYQIMKLAEGSYLESSCKEQGTGRK